MEQCEDEACSVTPIQRTRRSAWCLQPRSCLACLSCPSIPSHPGTCRGGLRCGLEVLGTASATLPCGGLWVQPSRAVSRLGVLCFCGSTAVPNPVDCSPFPSGMKNCSSAAAPALKNGMYLGMKLRGYELPWFMTGGGIYLSQRTELM